MHKEKKKHTLGTVPRHQVTVCRMVTAAGIMLFWAWFNADVLYKTEAQTLFLFDASFWHDMMRQPAGLLRYAGRFLTQTAHLPWLGGLLLALCWTGMEALMSKALRLPDALRPLLCLFAIAATMAQSYAGYYIYVQFDGALLFTLPLGLTGMAGLMLLLKRLPQTAAGLTASTGLIALAYGAMGFYGWAGGLAAAGLAWQEAPRRKALLLSATNMFTALLLPFIAYRFVWYAPLHVCRYAPLPGLSTPEPVMALAVAFALLLLTALLNIRIHRQTSPGRWGVPVLLAGMVLCFCGSFRNANFRAELRMQRLLEEGRFEEVIRIADKLDLPSRAVTAYRAAALDFTGQLGNALFRIPYGYTPIPARGAVAAETVFEREFSLMSSCINNCYMVTMTQVVNYGLRPSDLQFYTLCALFNGEKELAVKNLSMLGKTLFHRRWAAEHAVYLLHPERLAAHPVYGRIAEYMPDQNQLTNGSANVLELYLRMKQGDQTQLERHLMACLYLKDMDLFWMRIPHLNELFDEIPIHIQEAIALIGVMDRQDISAWKIEPAVLERTQQFVDQAVSFQDDFERARTTLEPTFGDMYGYYYIYRSLLADQTEAANEQSSVN